MRRSLEIYTNAVRAMVRNNYTLSEIEYSYKIPRNTFYSFVKNKLPKISPIKAERVNKVLELNRTFSKSELLESTPKMIAKKICANNKRISKIVNTIRGERR